MQQQRGFTLIEILLAVAIVTILSGLSVVVSSQSITQNTTRNARDSLVAAIDTARKLSIAGKQDSEWSLIAQNGSIVVFAGSDFITRNQAEDIIFDISPSITITPNSAIVFEKASGYPPLTTFTITNNNGGDVLSMTVNDYGGIND